MARKCENLRLNSFRDVLSIWRRKQCVSLSNTLICIMGHLTVALSVINLERIIYLISVSRRLFTFTPSSGAIQGWNSGHDRAHAWNTVHTKEIVCWWGFVLPYFCLVNIVQTNNLVSFFYSGSLFCVYGILNVFSNFIGAMIFNNVYESTLGIGFNGLVFLLNAGLKTFPLVIIR